MPMAVGMWGIATDPVFDGSVTGLLAWASLSAGSLASGFALGVAPEVRIHRDRVPATSPDAANAARGETAR